MKPGRTAIGLSCLSLCVLLTTGCAMDPTPDDEATFAQLRVDRDPVPAGEDLTLTLTNRSEEWLGYNLCVATLERRDGDAWVPAEEQPTEICTMELRTLQPEASDDFRHTIPPALAAGEYRMRTNVEWPLGEGQQTVATRSFRIDARSGQAR